MSGTVKLTQIPSNDIKKDPPKQQLTGRVQSQKTYGNLVNELQLKQRPVEKVEIDKKNKPSQMRSSLKGTGENPPPGYGNIFRSQKSPISNPSLIEKKPAPSVEKIEVDKKSQPLQMRSSLQVTGENPRSGYGDIFRSQKAPLAKSLFEEEKIILSVVEPEETKVERLRREGDKLVSKSESLIKKGAVLANKLEKGLIKDENSFFDEFDQILRGLGELYNSTQAYSKEIKKYAAEQKAYEKEFEIFDQDDLESIDDDPFNEYTNFSNALIYDPALTFVRTGLEELESKLTSEVNMSLDQFSNVKTGQETNADLFVDYMVEENKTVRNYNKNSFERMASLVGNLDVFTALEINKKFKIDINVGRPYKAVNDFLTKELTQIVETFQSQNISRK